MRKLWKKIKHAVQNWYRCQTQQCDYFEHYLAYGPAELTHEGYHAANRKCAYWQEADAKWMEDHPNALESPFRKQCETWEKRVRA